jgi:hypothetical protein
MKARYICVIVDSSGRFCDESNEHAWSYSRDTHFKFRPQRHHTLEDSYVLFWPSTETAEEYFSSVATASLRHIFITHSSNHASASE